MLLLEYRTHDSERFRVWLEEDAAYGSFHIVTRAELQVIVRACSLVGGVCRPAEDAHDDPIDMTDFPIKNESLSEIQLQHESIAST